MNKKILILLLIGILLSTTVSAGIDKIPIVNPFWASHGQYIATGFNGNLTKDLIWDSTGTTTPLNTTVNSSLTSIYLKDNLTRLMFPAKGVLLIDNEAIVYANFTVSSNLTADNTTLVTATRRGAYDTTAASHTANANVYFVRLEVGKDETSDPYFSIGTDGNTGLGNIVPDAKLHIAGDLIVDNSSLGQVLYVNTTSGKVEIWNPAEGAGDYLSLYHDATDGIINAQTGVLALQTGASSRLIIDGSNSNIRPSAANTYSSGTAAVEWLSLYLGENANSGIYFGLDQDQRIWNNGITNELRIEASANTTHLITPDLKIWDDAEGTGDYVTIYHDSTNGQFRVGSGSIFVNTNIWPTSSYDLGSTSYEWRSLILGEDASSGIYFGLDQDVRHWLNGTDNIYRIEATANNTKIITPALEIWDDAEGANDYVEIWHSGSAGYINFDSGGGYLQTANTDRYLVATDYFTPTTANSNDLGGTTSEWRGLYLGEDASSGAYFGLDQDWQLFYNETNADELQLIKASVPYMRFDTHTSIGDGDESAMTESSGDLYVTDELEVDGATYLEGGMDVTGSVTINGNLTIIGDYLNATVTNQYLNGSFLPELADTFDIGSTDREWDAVYVGDDDGVNFGNDQDGKMYYDTGGDLKIEATSDNVSVITNEFQVWDESEGAGDYVSIYHDGSNTNLDTASGSIVFKTAGTSQAVISSTALYPSTPNADDLGATSYEWNGLFLGEDAGSGAYFGLDQNFRLFYNETSADELQLTNGSDIFMRFDDIVSIGSADDTHSLVSPNDLFVTGKLEVDGASWFDSDVTFGGTSTIFVNYIMEFQDDDLLAMGTSSDAILDWSTAQATENTLVWGLGDTANSIIFTDNTYKNDDHDHPAQSNPTIILHSDLDPDTANTQWGSISHDNTSFVIDSGSDDIVLDDNTNIAGNLTMGDNEVGAVQLDIYDDGTDIVIDAVGDDSIKMVTTDLQVWDDAEGANDYVSIYHDGTDGRIDSKSGKFYLSDAGTNRWYLDGTLFLPVGANVKSIGSSAGEVLAFYLGEDASSGAYFGLDQNFQVWYNETSADQLQVTTSSGNILKINQTGEIYLLNGGMIYDNATCLILKSPSGSGSVEVCDT